MQRQPDRTERATMPAADAPQTAAPAAPESYTIQGQVVRLPVEVRDASSGFASFVVPAAGVRKLIPAGLQPVLVFPGKALCSIGAVEYRDNDLGCYNEVAIAFLVRAAAEPGTPLLDFIRGGVGAYIHHLPVTESFTCEAGSTIWGFPKTIEKIALTDTDGRRSCRLVMDGAHVLTLTLKNRGRWSFRDAPVEAFSYRDGVLRRTPFVSSGEQVGYRLGGATLELGAHPIADELRALGLPRRPLMSGWVGRMRARFEAPQVLRRDSAHDAGHDRRESSKLPPLAKGN